MDNDVVFDLDNALQSLYDAGYGCVAVSRFGWCAHGEHLEPEDPIVLMEFEQVPRFWVKKEVEVDGVHCGESVAPLEGVSQFLGCRYGDFGRHELVIHSLGVDGYPYFVLIPFLLLDDYVR